MFRHLQCIQKGSVRMPGNHKGSAVYADDYGGVWAVSADAQEVYYYTAHTLASSMELQPTTLPPFVSSSASSSPLTSSPPTPHTLAFRCGKLKGVSEAEHPDSVHSILFFNGDASSSTALQHRRDVCVVTEGGTVAFLRVPMASGEPPLLLQPFQEVRLGLRVSAATATANAVILCCFDGAFTEVVRAVVVPEAAAAAAATPSARVQCPHQSDMAMPDAICACEVEATGLFRVQGCVLCVLFDSVRETIVTVSDAGNVDVWDVALGRDVTAQFGSPAWDAAKHGSATCAIICREKLWVGLNSGQLAIFSFVSSDRLTEDDAAQRALGATTMALLLRSHSSPITGVIPMSLQSSVWSCAAANGSVNVWDATDASFRGSFVFPEPGIQSWYASVAQLRAALWGIDGASGEPCLMQISESISRADAYVCSGTDARKLHAQERLLQSYRRCWRGLLRDFRVVHQGAQDSEKEDWRGETMAAALEDIEADLKDIDDVVGLVRKMQTLMASLHRLCAVDRRVRGGRARPVNVVLEEFLDDWLQRIDTRDEVESFLSSLNAVCGGGRSIHSLDDVQELFTHLSAHAEELQQALGALEQSKADESIAAAAGGAADALRTEQMSLEESLHVAEARSQELELLLREAHEERRSALEQKKHLEQLLEDAEGQLEEAKRSLLAMKRAAEVTATEVSSVFDMESKLHVSQGVISSLSAKVEALLKDTEAKEGEVQAFRSKEKAAKEVLQSVLRVQNAMADDTGDFAAEVHQLIVAATEGQRIPLSKPLKELLDTIREKTYKLEASIESRLREQKMWFHTLSKELKVTVT
ncbi:hypothetical protein ABL78_5304 [Leptomonas seymouri]|uniref:Wd40 repeat domain-containing protein n=1 Tax=Leptomonas seymouri TaxID=5684 RepID=A0A0N1HVC8_LEPSE|nr:hypothetical protein ABL78_5304 [Leptomonas seymouri]|eukprot:KPI85623.1 hypothetical protein ABL78_5304 [Leptomonas seymouri]